MIYFLFLFFSSVPLIRRMETKIMIPLPCSPMQWSAPLFLNENKTKTRKDKSWKLVYCCCFLLQCKFLLDISDRQNSKEVDWFRRLLKKFKVSSSIIENLTFVSINITCKLIMVVTLCASCCSFRWYLTVHICNSVSDVPGPQWYHTVNATHTFCVSSSTRWYLIFNASRV